MVRIAAEDLDDCMFVDADGNVLDPAVTPYVLTPDPKVRRADGPGHLPLEVEVEMEPFDEAERACDAANARMGWTREEADRVILASMGGGTA